MNFLIHLNFFWLIQLKTAHLNGNDIQMIADIVNVDYISKQLTYESKY